MVDAKGNTCTSAAVTYRGPLALKDPEPRSRQRTWPTRCQRLAGENSQAGAAPMKR